MLHIKHVDKEFQNSYGSLRYDKILDKSDFRPDANPIREAMRAAGSSGSDIGLYDFQDKKTDYTPSDLELSLRSGKLDKAEVQVALRNAELDARAEDKQSKQRKAELDALRKNQERAKAVDLSLGLSDNVAK